MGKKPKIHRKPLSRYHPQSGQPTIFVEKVWLSLIDDGQLSLSKVCELSREIGIGNFDMNNIRKCQLNPKGHTIRGGNKVTLGDFIQFYSWIGKPYGKGSTTINIAPLIEVKKTWNFELLHVDRGSVLVINGVEKPLDMLLDIAKNDGLELSDMLAWFKHPKKWVTQHQIICWNESIEY